MSECNHGPPPSSLWNHSFHVTDNPTERVQQRIVEHMIEVPTSQVVEEIVEEAIQPNAAINESWSRLLISRLELLTNRLLGRKESKPSHVMVIAYCDGAEASACFLSQHRRSDVLVWRVRFW